MAVYLACGVLLILVGVFWKVALRRSGRSAQVEAPLPMVVSTVMVVFGILLVLGGMIGSFPESGPSIPSAVPR